MNLDKSLKSTDSTTNVFENTETQTFGNILLTSSTFYPLQPLLKIKFSVCMEDYPQALTRWTTFVRSIESRKYLMKDPCAISSGRTQMIVVDGGFLREVLGIPLVRIFQKRSIIIMALLWSLEHINSSWRPNSCQCFVLIVGIQLVSR